MASNLRQRLLGAKSFREKVLTVTVGGEDINVLVRQPTVAQRNAILGDVDTSAKSKIGQDRMTRLQVVAVVQCALDPETRAPIFEEADIADLAEQPAGSWVDALASAVMGLADDGAAAAKN